MTTRIAQHLRSAMPQAFSVLQAQWKDWAFAEDCLQDAVEKALVHWQFEVPDNPAAWLVTVARRAAIDSHRKTQRLVGEQEPPERTETDFHEDELEASLTDDVLRLMICCCHPELDQETQLALTLKHVAAFTTAEVANGLLVSEKTMEQRLTRAKKKLSTLNLSFEMPVGFALEQRLLPVLHVIYLIYNEGYCASEGGSLQRNDLCSEAMRLTRWLHQLVRHDQNAYSAEIIGLLALMQSQQARRFARVDAEGRLVLLEDQDRTQWVRADIMEAQVLVEKALKMGHVGPFQIQAAISALHNQASAHQQTDWTQIRLLYQTLLRQQDTPVIRLNYGIALAKDLGTDVGLTFIATLAEKLDDYLPYHTAVAVLNRELGNLDCAKAAYKRALKLADNERVKNHLSQQLSDLSA